VLKYNLNGDIKSKMKIAYLSAGRYVHCPLLLQNAGALPELIEHDKTGIRCDVDSKKIAKNRFI
jgi:hypothetical protein